MMKRITVFFILITILFSCINITYAIPLDKSELLNRILESTDKYTCGDDMTALLADGALIISGSGYMYNYGYGTAPWTEKSESITEVEIDVKAVEFCTADGRSVENAGDAAAKAAAPCLLRALFQRRAGKAVPVF